MRHILRFSKPFHRLMPAKARSNCSSDISSPLPSGMYLRPTYPSMSVFVPPGATALTVTFFIFKNLILRNSHIKIFWQEKTSHRVDKERRDIN